MKSDTNFYKFSQSLIPPHLCSSLFIQAPFVFLVVLALSLPFELITPLWAIGPLSITNVELALFLTLAFTAVLLIQTRGKGAWPDRYWLWLLPFVAGLLLSVLLAPQLQANALKASLRLLSGILLALTALQIMRRPYDGRILSLALLGSGLIAAAIGWWEISQAELSGMSLFRSHITRAGSIFRLTGPFDYANQAAMFMEATLPFLAAAAWSVSGKKLPRRFKIPLLALLFLFTLFYGQALILTLSRAGAATVVVVCLLLAVLLAVRQPAAKRKMAAWWLGLAGITAVLIAANLFLSDQARLRLQGGNIDHWYRAQIIAPPTLEMAAGATVEAPITVVNQSVFIWRSHDQSPILLGARLLNEAGTQAHSELRWPFPGSVHPQETVQIRAAFTAPLTPGVYELRWDVVQEDVTWFGANSGLYATSLVTVLPAAGQAEQSQPDPIVMGEQAAWEYSGPIPDRTTLWAVALHMIGERPLSGIGLDNFRLTYGERLGNSNYDKSVHTNNFYLEMFVSMGIIGTFPFIIWSAALLIDILRTLRRPNATMWQAAWAAGLLAYYIHGFFDFFLLFNATGLLFWLLTALWLSGKRSYAYWI